MPMRDALVKPRPSKRLRDLGVYVLVSVICVGSIILAATEGVPEQKFLPWFGFVLFTLFLFGQFILKSKRVLQKKSFWLVTALGGNAVAGVVDAIRDGLSIGDLLMGGTHMGIGGEGPVQKGVGGVAQDAAVGASWSSITGAGQAIQSLNGATSIASTGIGAAKFATAVGWTKLAYDFGSYAAGLGGCAAGIVH